MVGATRSAGSFRVNRVAYLYKMTHLLYFRDPPFLACTV